MNRPLDQPDLDVEMSFWDHLEALRWHIIRSGIAVAVFAIIAFLSKNILFDTIFLGPYHLDFWTYKELCRLSGLAGMGDSLCVHEMGFTLINTELAGQFSQHISMAISTGVVLGFPYAAFELWRFIRPALSPKERNSSMGIVWFSTLLFMLGILFGYFIITPITVQFLGTYRISEEIKNTIQITDYIQTVIMTTFTIALVFELPMVIFFLSRAGILGPKLMRQYRKHAIVIILIVAAVITPSTDMLTMTLVAIPFMVLYELSIGVAYYNERRRKKREAV
jgi:sec-independent protein translocase protein TatC